MKLINQSGNSYASSLEVWIFGNEF